MEGSIKMHDLQVDPAIITRLHSLSQEIGIPKARLINLALAEGLYYFEKMKREIPDLLDRVIEAHRR